MDNDIQRCTKCLLPRSYPRIKFNKYGVCNFCDEYKQKDPYGEDLLLKKIQSKKGEKYDCVVGISGGKDSCYVAYIAKKHFSLRVLAVLYDFPFLCDLARQNVHNVCNALNIDLIIEKSKKNVEYDLVRNHLMSTAATGTSWGQCLFCHYGIDAILYNIANKEKIPYILSGVTKNELSWDPGNRTKILLKRIKKLRMSDKGKFIYYQLKAYLDLVAQRREFRLPSNSSLTAYRKPINPQSGPEVMKIFDYIRWDQKNIEDTLMKQAGWIKPNRPLSWRYDCILEPMIDYTYKKEFGISTVGLYLSDLIRSNKITRDEAKKILQKSEDKEVLQKAVIHVFNFLKIPKSFQEDFLNTK